MLKPPRTALLAGALLVLVTVFAAVALWSTSPPPPLSCAPEEVRMVDGVAVCGLDGGAPRPGQLLALGGKLPLNRASAEDLAALPKIGPALAAEIVAERERLGGFSSWDDVDGVAGVGPALLDLLKEHAVLTR